MRHFQKGGGWLIKGAKAQRKKKRGKKKKQKWERIMSNGSSFTQEITGGGK